MTSILRFTKTLFVLSFLVSSSSLASAQCVNNPDGRRNETRIQFENFYLMSKNNSSVQLLVKGALGSSILSKPIKVDEGEVAVIEAFYQSGKVSYDSAGSEKLLEIWYTRDLMLIVFTGEHLYKNKSNFYSIVGSHGVECGDLPKAWDVNILRETFKDYRKVDTDSVTFTSQEAVLDQLGL